MFLLRIRLINSLKCEIFKNNIDGFLPKMLKTAEVGHYLNKLLSK